jgi:hypothetical protein
VQTGMVERNAGLPPEKRIEFRIGIHKLRPLPCPYTLLSASRPRIGAPDPRRWDSPLASGRRPRKDRSRRASPRLRGAREIARVDAGGRVGVEG